MTKLAVALAAASMLSAPAAMAEDGKGYAYGKDPKVCLVTFLNQEGVRTGVDALVTKAQYLPLRIAQRLEMQNSLSDIYTYGAQTESTCAYLSNLADQIYGDDDDGDEDDDMDS